MAWRRTSSTTAFGTDIPFAPKFCSRVCACPGMWYRTRLTTTFGGASPCRLSLVVDGVTRYYRRLDTNITGQWKRTLADGGAVVKECSGSTYNSVSGNIPNCNSESGGTFECEAPEGYEGIPLNYVQESTTTGSNELNSADAAAAARSVATTSTLGWGSWVQGYPGGVLAAGGSVDTRGPLSCSFTDRLLEIEFAGSFRPFMIRRQESVTTRYEDGSPSTTTTEFHDLEVLTADPVAVEWIAAANVNRSVTGSLLCLPL